jgi:hypothetical protein
MVVESLFGSVKQIGYAVADLDSAMAAFRRADQVDVSFDVFETTLDETGNYRYRGQPDRCVLRIGIARIGGLDFELIQTLSGNHPSRDYVQRCGDGINHLGVYIEDLQHWKTHLLPARASLIIEGQFDISPERKGQFAYVQLAGGGPLYELLQL